MKRKGFIEEGDFTNRRINKKYQKENDSIDSLGVVFSNSREKDVIINSIIVSDWRSKRELFLMGIGFIFLILLRLLCRQV